jgi:hypothetical protein
MKRFLLSLVIALGASTPAQATVHNVAPPGNAGVNQYIESIPTDHGNQPTNSVHHKSSSGHSGATAGGGGSSSGGSAGGSGGSSGTTGGSSSGATGSGPIPATTQRALSSKGADGRAAAALASNTAPNVAPRRHMHAASSAPMPAPAKTSGGSTALGSVAAALTGSGSSGGLGTMLPVILVVALLGSAAMAIRRRRGET